MFSTMLSPLSFFFGLISPCHFLSLPLSYLVSSSCHWFSAVMLLLRIYISINVCYQSRPVGLCYLQQSVAKEHEPRAGFPTFKNAPRGGGDYRAVKKGSGDAAAASTELPRGSYDQGGLSRNVSAGGYFHAPSRISLRRKKRAESACRHVTVNDSCPHGPLRDGPPRALLSVCGAQMSKALQ